jgi:hypothetical protein
VLGRFVRYRLVAAGFSSSGSIPAGAMAAHGGGVRRRQLPGSADRRRRRLLAGRAVGRFAHEVVASDSDVWNPGPFA